jgi:uncharacterized protein with PIN domain
MTDKPSRNEDEYFARQEAERLEQSRAEIQRVTIESERKSHYMKCPKCGADLNTVDYHGVQVDRCPECDGVWFDAGEVESLVEKDTGVIDVLRSMIRTVS